MKIFLSVTSLKPSYGGPARSVSRLAEVLAASGVEIGVWAADGSALDTPFLAGGMGIQRLGGTPEQGMEEFGKADLIHDNGIWRRHHYLLAGLAAKRGIPRIVSTRGMVEPWALNHKRLKKRLAWQVYQKSGLQSAAALHATAGAELEQIKRLGLTPPVHMVPNGVDLPELGTSESYFGNPVRTALFVGRVHPVKGLPLLIEAWRRVQPTGWRLRVVGPDEGGHRAQLEELVERAGLAAVWTFEGELDGPAKREAFEAASLLLLPTHTENFGMVVAEALAYRLPVITTRGAPWERLPQEGCGWWTTVSVAGLAEAMAEATGLGPAELRAMGDRGRLWMQREFAWTAVGEKIRQMYETVLK